MPTTTKKCNLCHAELRVSNEAQTVVCPACGCINGYGYSRSNQNDKYTKAAPSNKNTGVMPNSQYFQQQPFPAAPTQGQEQLHALLGGTKQPRSLHFVDTSSLFQQPSQASSEYSPPLARTNNFLQTPAQVSPSSQVSIRMLKTNYTSFQQLSQKSLSLPSSLPPVKTKTTFQLPSQTSSPPIPERIINNFFQQPQQTSSPQGSPLPSYNNISYQQPFQTSSLPDQDEVDEYSWQPQKAPTPQGSPRPAYTNISYQQPFQTSSPPGQDKVNEFSWQPQKTPSAQGSPRPYSYTPYQQPLISSPRTAEKTKNSFENPQETSSPHGSPRPAYTNSNYPQPLRTLSPLIPEKTNNFSQLPQRTSSLQWQSRPAYGNTSYEETLQTSQPLIQEKLDNFSQLAPQTSSPQGSPRLANSNASYQPPLQLSQPPIQEKINSSSEPQHQTASPKGSPNPSYSNTSNQQPIQSSPQESPHQPQTSSPQGSSPRPSRFSSFLKPRSAQTPPQASSPLAHSDDQKLSQPFSQISTPLSREDNNGHNHISTPPSREVSNGYSQRPLLASPQVSASQVQPLLQAPRLSVNSSDQNYQKSVPDARPVSSSIASPPPLTGPQHIRYGTNQGTSGKFATANSQSADNQNSRNIEVSISKS